MCFGAFGFDGYKLADRFSFHLGWMLVSSLLIGFDNYFSLDRQLTFLTATPTWTCIPLFTLIRSLCGLWRLCPEDLQRGICPRQKVKGITCNSYMLRLCRIWVSLGLIYRCNGDFR